MNYARIAIAAAVATVVFFIFGFIVEGVLIRKDFAPYTAVYRSAETVQKYIPVGLSSVFLAILTLAVMFTKAYPGGANLSQGAGFGLMAGILVACVHPITNFVTMNLGAKLSWKIAVSNVVQWMLIGALIASIYKPSSTTVSSAQ
ncbi:MAG TPA: hypothetical protein VN943_10370 [Candidatus Acidoferrum sp.]|nr:hypothetical protein [Candidatus Acidoferrum sp.]